MLSKRTVYIPTLIIVLKYNLDQKLESEAYVLESHAKINSKIYCSTNCSRRFSFPTWARTRFILVLEKWI